MSNMEQAMRELAAKMTGGNIDDVPSGNLEEICSYIAEHYAGGSGTAEKTTADTLEGATDTGKSLLKAADAAAARKAIGAGTSSFSGKYTDLSEKPVIPAAYTLPSAGAAIGGVKKAAAVAFTADGATTETTAAALAALIKSLQASGALA